MTKPNKKTIAEKLEAWVRNEKKRLNLEGQYDLDIEPYVTRYQRAIGPITEERDLKVAPLNETKKQLEAEIISMLEAGIDRETGKVALPQVEIERAIARVAVSEGNRFIAPEEFFKFTREPNRNERFWGCVTIPIGKATKFLGSAIDRLATKATKFEVKISLKD